ncbi:MAG: CDP-alcohol phosphatidyltransferase family protein [Polyangiaceae bacterium]
MASVEPSLSWWRGAIDRRLASPARSGAPGRPEPARALANRALAPLARALVAAGVTANAVTALALLLSGVAAFLLAMGRFDVAAPLIILASVGDALDGIVARTSGSASRAGALFDAAADRYQELAILSGLAVHLHASVPALLLVLAAVLASFMVSYGSAKAEAFGVRVPDGSMRRFERALCLCGGIALMPGAASLVRAGVLGPWLIEAPLLVALSVVAVVGNASAVRRLRAIAASVSSMPAEAFARESSPSKAKGSL